MLFEPTTAQSRPRVAAPVDQAPTVAIAAGGTGGHIYPGLAIAAALRRARREARVIFVGTPRGMERELIPAAGHELFLTDMVPFVGGVRSQAAAIGRTATAVAQSRRLLREERVDAVIGMGGYPSFPVVLAARLAGVPALIHESNAVPGRANRLAGRLRIPVGLSIGADTGWNPAAETRVVGMPVGADLRDFDRAALRPAARASLGVAGGETLVVVSGGSQGSAQLDRAALDLARHWRDRRGVRILVKASRGERERLETQVRRSGAERVATVVDYFERMDEVYAAADLMVCRAGAATVAELAVTGVPAVLVPYPHAPGDHQTHNAEALVRAGGAVRIADDRAGGDSWCELLDSLVGSPGRLARMSEAAEALIPVDGAERMAAWALELTAGAAS
jgi:UDP-N-acetylglucosamine--N-acetylmuramyl-(pentapeptide) pyrophosphoryl-undecaprenol N-acetylglucosamine transferase